MKKTIYSTIINDKENTYWYGDKLLRIVSAIIDIIEIALIIYLLVR